MQTSQTIVSDVYSKNCVFWSDDTHCLRTYCEHWSSLTLKEFLDFSIWMKYKLSDFFNKQKPIWSSGCVENFNIPARMWRVHWNVYWPKVFSKVLESFFFTEKIDTKHGGVCCKMRAFCPKIWHVVLGSTQTRTLAWHLISFLSVELICATLNCFWRQL